MNRTMTRLRAPQRQEQRTAVLHMAQFAMKFHSAYRPDQQRDSLQRLRILYDAQLIAARNHFLHWSNGICLRVQ